MQHTILDILTAFLLSAIPAAFNFFLDYCLGHPMSDRVNTKAIFFRYSLSLALKALPEKQYREIVSALAPLLNSSDKQTRKEGKKQLDLSIMTAGREYFFYEQAFGMCPFCTNFWVALICSAVFFFTIPLYTINPIFFFLLTPIFSHSILRKL